MERESIVEEGAEGVRSAIRDGTLYVRVTELLLNTKLSRGEYNRIQVYGHVKAEPLGPWVMPIPIEDGEDPFDLLQRTIERMQDVVSEVVRKKADELDRLEKGGRAEMGVEVSTPVRTISGFEPGRRAGVNSMPPEPDKIEDEF